LAEDRDQRGGECLETEVGKPEAKVELIGHDLFYRVVMRR
jgi:hypothetical protein